MGVLAHIDQRWPFLRGIPRPLGRWGGVLLIRDPIDVLIEPKSSSLVLLAKLLFVLSRLVQVINSRTASYKKSLEMENNCYY